jgi:nitrite reductase/ring-hydroxylating ferredoxin subunit/uncharacterized membrane protein
MLQPFVKAIQDSTVLDRAADPVQPVARQWFRATQQPGSSLKNFLSGTWIGHPLHPILKDVPIGAWTMAAIFDVMNAFERDGSLQRASDIAVVAGITGALASAVTGLADWSDTKGRARRIGVLHAALNVSATALYVAAIATRSRRSSRVRLAFGGYGIMLLGAYLGGHLVFGQQIGVNHATQSELPSEFLPVMRDADLPENTPHRVQYNGLPVVLVRRNARVYALYERCAHMSGPLAEGSVEGNAIRCPWHGSCFSLEDGSVLEGPATNPQPSFETRIADGQILIRSREPESP